METNLTRPVITSLPPAFIPGTNRKNGPEHADPEELESAGSRRNRTDPNTEVGVCISCWRTQNNASQVDQLSKFQKRGVSKCFI